MHLTAGQVQIFGDLAARLAGTDHQHLTGRRALAKSTKDGLRAA
jgi:hypothetical protein